MFNLQAYPAVHVLISLAAITAGFGAAAGMPQGKRLVVLVVQAFLKVPAVTPV
jgi:hypothetical protein